MILYRPTGIEELRLVYESKMKNWPPRLPDQPIFYPVLNNDYACQIAKDWNAKSINQVGFVTRFEVEDKYIGKFKKEIVGSKVHEELWIPAEELIDFNRHMGDISVTNAFFGPKYSGYIPDKFGLKGKDAKSQFECLAATLGYSGMDFICEIQANHMAVYLNMMYWRKIEIPKETPLGQLKEKVIDAIDDIWSQHFKTTPLPRYEE